MAIIGKDLRTAYELLTSGEVVAIPTETVYGLAGNAFNKNAIAKIYACKNRPQTNPLIVHISNIDCLRDYALEIPESAIKLAEKFWPGSLTLLLPKSDKVINEVTAGLPNVALRMPAHPLTLDLLRRLPFPLAAPSANPYGYISPTSPQHVNNQLGEKIKYIIDGGECTKGIESSIFGFEDNVPIIFRKGVITEDDIKEVTGSVKFFQNQIARPVTSGLSLSHYAPKTPVYLTNNINEIDKDLLTQNFGILAFKNTLPIGGKSKQVILSHSGNLGEAAKNLYGALHQLDSLELDLIIAELVPDEGIGKAINDRLTRAGHRLTSKRNR